MAVIDAILFFIYVNDSPDHSGAGNLLNADNGKLIAAYSNHEIIQSSVNVSSSWSRDWELDFIPTKSETPHSIIYTLPHHIPTNAQKIAKVSLN